MGKLNTYLYLILSLSFFIVNAQDAKKFEQEVNNLVAGDSAVEKKKLIVFTGSSSVRFWSDLQDRYRDYNVINRGFGGSQMSDLIYYADKLIFKYKPKQIFIYEGDNDLSLGKSPETILSEAQTLLKMIRKNLPKKVKVSFISAKPSVSRWHLKESYEKYNALLKDWAATQKNVTFIDVWTPLLTSSGTVRQDIFKEDNLHLNAIGYDIWSNAIEDYLSPKLKK
ncbi:SGNH/GDSL hydrolase family protein [Chryseosolibacter indicus]|uniref:G-D-S-L family lipolytic protein n=1 Tax=Chryseosolibacter indicus TaxID=2782351 RepID=A0ABS5VYJ9_9BACT|nr:SGNH/GDSL hydrolase family protein [Chryseosolibacter indicus]MBT1706497.1 G-D-S-L family lipolytic protein [Chryseosolibacter indicus]